MAEQLDAPSETLHQDPGQYRDRPCDFTIKCADGSLTAHKALLASESDYFKALFDASMMENELSQVRLNHTSIATMTKVVDFIYQRPLNLHFRCALELIVVAQYLQMAALGARCLEILTAETSLGHALHVYYLAVKYNIDDLREFGLGYLAKNIALLMPEDNFLVSVNADLMRTLLESDQLVVPHEDSVFHFVAAWIRRRDSRNVYADEFRELIRFPFLTCDALAELEHRLGPITCLQHRSPGARWNLELAAFRRRKYTIVHCHSVWQKMNSLWPHCSNSCLLLVCKSLGESHNVHVCGVTGLMNYLEGVVVSGHTIYSRNYRSLYSYPCRNESHFIPLEPKQVDSLPIRSHGNLPEIQLYGGGNGNLEVCSYTYRDRTLRRKVNMFRNSARRFKKIVETMTHLPASADARSQGPLSDRLVLDKPQGHLIDLRTGHIYELGTPPGAEDDEPTVSWKSVLRKSADTVWLGYHSGQSDVVRDLNVRNNQWGRIISDPEPNSDANSSMQLEMIQGEIYKLTIKSDSRSFTQKVTTKKLDEINGVFENEWTFLVQDSCFIGMVPVDAAPPCAMDTWLSTQIRMLPDKTPTERAFIEKLRAIAG